MTANYFKRLFAYDFWANERLLSAMEATPELAEEAVKKMSHLLSAKAIWAARLMPGIQVPPLDGMFSPEERKRLNGELKARMDEYLSQIKDGQLEEKISYKNLKGMPYENILSDILAHMVNHGSYHRGQVASFTKKSGGNPPGTDYIGFVRE